MKKHFITLLFLFLLLLTGCAQKKSAVSSKTISVIPSSPPPAVATPTRPSLTIAPLEQTQQTIQPAITVSAPASLTPISTRTIPPPTATPMPTLFPIPGSILVNGLPPESFVHLPPETIQRSQEILAQGLIRGRDPLRFSKIGGQHR